MPDMSTSLPDGTRAIKADKSARMVVRGGQWVNDDTYVPPRASVKPTTQDMAELNASNARAAAERDATRQYVQAAGAIQDLGGTGPWQEALMAAGAPGQAEDGPDRGWLANTLSTIGGLAGSAVGAAVRPLYSQRQLAARDRLRTIGAQGALSRASQLKGAASDKDIALVRVAGLDPGKVTEENNRVVHDAIYQSGLEQARSLVLSNWIADNGSLAAKNRGGQTYQEALQRAEAVYGQRFAERQAARRQRGLPKPPPSARGNQVVTIDLDGNEVR